MINAHSLLPRSWILHEKRGIERFMTLIPRYKDPELLHKAYFEGEEPYEWLVNGCTEDEWSGIPVSPALLCANGFVMRQDNEWIRSYGLPNRFYVTWIQHNGGPFGDRGTILAGPDKRPIEFVHELQLQYFATCKKFLNFIL